jgi:hypothetical protein
MMEPTTENVTSKEESPTDLNADIALMVKEISKIGPRVPEIARRLGRHKETVRYWYKKLEEHNFAIQAITDHEAFGLKRIVMKVRFEEDYVGYVKPLMFAMNDLCYVVSYAKAMAEDYYTINCSVPEELVPEYLSFAEDLKQMGVFRSFEVYRLDWIRNIPMHGEFYDFGSGRWDFDMQSVTNAQTAFEPPVIHDKAKFDRIDLLIAKELFVDATRELQEIQLAIKEKDGVEINYKTLCWHLKEHVMGKGLLKGFRINWMGTRWDAVLERAKQRSHSFVGIHFFVKDPSEQERLELMRKFDRIPFVWAEGAGRDYFVELDVPTEQMLDCMEYIQTAMAPVRERASCHIMDQRDAVGFTMSYQLYDDESRTWKFNREELLVRFKALETQVRQSG